MLELVTHALTVAVPGTRLHAELEAAAADTADLRDLLGGKGAERLTINDRALMHALGTLWEAGQSRVETLAAGADRAWHRRWKARSVVERQLRRGSERRDELALPYTT